MKVFIIAAMSADGYIAKDIGAPSTAWTSKEDKKHFVEITKDAGAIIMGKKTFETIGRALPGRRNIIYSADPIEKDGVEATSLPPKDLLEKLRKEKVEKVAICGGQTIYTMFMDAGLVDSMHITIEPVIFGAGLTLFGKALNAKIKLAGSETKNQTTFLKFDIVK